VTWSIPSTRWKSPLRWLWTVIGSLAVIGAAGLSGIAWLLLALPVVWALFLLAPPIGVFRHDETPRARTGLAVELTPIADSVLGSQGYWIVLVNTSDTDAVGFALRLLVPWSLSPRNHPIKPLGHVNVGELGRQWFIESVEGATALTFRPSTGPETAPTFPAHNRVELAELRLPAGRQASTRLSYQISGGTAATVLGELALPE
jgi:hypothetical protein